MEIKRIISLCKSSNGLILYENEGEQWISDGYALFPLTEMPLFDEETICRTYDISEKKAAKMSIRHEMKLPQNISVAGDVDGEMPCEFDDELFARIVPVWTSQGLMFIQRRYLTPFADTPADMLYLFERRSPTGGVYFAVKVGFQLMGLITPYECVNEGFVERIKRIYDQCEVALKNKKEKDNDRKEIH